MLHSDLGGEPRGRGEDPVHEQFCGQIEVRTYFITWDKKVIRTIYHQERDSLRCEDGQAGGEQRVHGELHEDCVVEHHVLDVI